MINRTIVQGRLVEDPVMRMTKTGTPVASFRVAWSEKRGERENKLFLPCTAWGHTAEFADRYFKKGKQCGVEGKLGTRTWVDQDGNNRSTIEMTVEGLHFCGDRESLPGDRASLDKAGNYKNELPGDPYKDSGLEDFTDDDGSLPF